MIGHLDRARRAILTAATWVMASGCDQILGNRICTTELVSSIAIEVRDPSGAPAALGVTAISEHEAGVVTELTALDDLVLFGNWQRELRGRHLVTIRKPGLLPEVIEVAVGSNECHVDPETVRARIRPDPAAVPVAAIAFTEGPQVDAWPASAGIRVFGDTLQISGFAPTDCTLLRAVAYRRGVGLHVQIEPSTDRIQPCISPRQFEVRYELPPEDTHLLVTNGFSFPVQLFDGSVSPE